MRLNHILTHESLKWIDRASNKNVNCAGLTLNVHGDELGVKGGSSDEEER